MTDGNSHYPNPETIQGEPCLRLTSDLVKAHVTPRGGHLAPVEFKLKGGQTASPYSLPPWDSNEHPDMPSLLQVLRGDFFCFPFGVTEGIELPHGATANDEWRVESHESHRLELSLNPDSVLVGNIRRVISLEEGHRALYQEHRIEGVSGNFNYGHHPILQFPEGVQCPVRLSPWKFGQVYPTDFANPAQGEYSSLEPGAEICSLDQVELARGGHTSLASYPAREGYEDLVMFSSAAKEGLAWTAITFPGYVWVSLRSVEQFPSTILWMSNGGRHQVPWEGKHRRRMGVEDVCSHFHDGAHVSGGDLLRARNIKTSRSFRSDEIVALRHAQFVHPVEGQPGLKSIHYGSDPSSLALEFEDRQTSHAAVNWRWLSGHLKD